MKKILPYLSIALLVFVFFWQFFLKGLLPIPSDTIIGLYHPFRDLYIKNYQNGIPFKNFLITDPVRQQYPWKELVISIEKNFQLPLWNPYSFSGTPLLGNFQSGSFYIMNNLFFVLPFEMAWSLIIFLGPLLGGLFLFLYLNNLKLNKLASILGAATFSFSGFFIAWLEWGNITHVMLWLPLILLSIDKIFSNKKNLKWIFTYLFSLIFSFFAGHLQIFFYLFVFSWLYLLARWIQFGAKKKILLSFIILNSLFVILTSFQWIPTLQFILLSARNVDIGDYNNPGWFIPWQHFIQFIAPDYFGNPTTLNYWGVWNYMEFIGYVGIIPLILSIFAIIYRRDKKTLFFASCLVVSLVLAFPTFLAKIPYLLGIPFLSTAQPTRLISIIDFTLAILAALGMDYLLRTRKLITILYPLILITLIFACLWLFIPQDHFKVVKSNLLLPTFIFGISSTLFIFLLFMRKREKIMMFVCALLVLIAVFDLFRFGWKFTPFTPKSYLFPSTNTINFLQKNLGKFRFMTTDSRIFPPNFSTIYRLQSVDGYDPLYLLRYGELISASERNKPNIDPPFGFYRIITPHNYQSRIMDLLGVKYVLSFNFSKLDLQKLTKVFMDEQMVIYENRHVLLRTFFVKNVKTAKNKKEAINMLFDSSINLSQTGIVENGPENLKSNWSVGSANIANYSESEVSIDTENQGEGFLILTDTFYPTWKAIVDGNPETIFLTDYNLRGIVVPAGKHRIVFHDNLF